MSVFYGLLLLTGLIAAAAMGFIIGRCSAETKNEDFYDEE